MTNASVLVRAARKSSGLTQKDLAERTNVDQGRVSRVEGGREAEFSTVERFLRGAGYRLYSAPTRRDDAATIAAAIRGYLRAGDKYSALREFIQLSDNLNAEHGLVRGVLGLAEPEPTGDRVWDAALAALVDFRLREEGLPLRRGSTPRTGGSTCPVPWTSIRRIRSRHPTTCPRSSSSVVSLSGETR